jgi:hypothetical protein
MTQTYIEYLQALRQFIYTILKIELFIQYRVCITQGTLFNLKEFLSYQTYSAFHRMHGDGKQRICPPFCMIITRFFI